MLRIDNLGVSIQGSLILRGISLRVAAGELNLGQLAKLLRMDFDVKVVGLNKIKGIHFRAAEIEACILELTEHD